MFSDEWFFLSLHVHDHQILDLTSSMPPNQTIFFCNYIFLLVGERYIPYNVSNIYPHMKGHTKHHHATLRQDHKE
jgi:hypothetical protein